MVGLRTNLDIKEDKVLLIDEGGKKLGVMPLAEAISIAKAKSSDVVEVSASTESSPSVCRIMNYGKFKFQSTRIIKKNKKKKNNSEKTKEIRLTARIHKNDLDFKRKSTKTFLEKGYKIRVYCLLKGASIASRDSVKEMMEEFVESCDAKYDAPVNISGRMVQCVITSK